VDDLIKRLVALAFAEHDDLSVAAEAVARIAQLEAEKARLVGLVRDMATELEEIFQRHGVSRSNAAELARNLLNELGAE